MTYLEPYPIFHSYLVYASGCEIANQINTKQLLKTWSMEIALLLRLFISMCAYRYHVQISLNFPDLKILAKTLI